MHHYTTAFEWCLCLREIIDTFPHLEKYVAFISDTAKARSFKLCMIIILLGVYIFIVGLMTLTLFQGHRCVRNINCKLCFVDSCVDSCRLYLNVVATCIKKIMHNMKCVTGVCVCSREILYMFLVSQVWVCQKLQYLDFLRHHKCDKCQTLHDGTTYRALPVHYTFSDLDISLSAVTNSLN